MSQTIPKIRLLNVRCAVFLFVFVPVLYDCKLIIFKFVRQTNFGINHRAWETYDDQV